MLNNKDVTLLIMSSDNYEDCWQPFIKLKKKYWNDCPYDMYFCTETKTVPFIKTIKTQGAWTKRYREALQQINSKYVITMLDDFFIREKVDQKRIDYILENFDEDTIMYNFEIVERPTLSSDKVGFDLQKNNQNYLNICHSAFWDREKLLERLKDDEDAWTWELKKIDSPYKHYVNNSNKIINIGQDYGKLFGIARGKWTIEAYRFLKQEGFNIDFRKRGFFKGALGNRENKPMLSIIIPFYKVWDYAKILLENLENQITDDVEIIVVDDGCNDERLDIFQAFDIIHCEKNGGLSKARNIGLRKSVGVYKGFIDSDDNVSTDYIEKIMNKIYTTDFDYLCFSWKFTGEKDDIVIIKGEPASWNHCVWNTIYKGSIIGEFDEEVQIIEDGKFNSMYRKGKRANIEDVLYYYLWGRKDSLSKRFENKEIEIKFKSENNDEVRTKIIIYRYTLSKLGGIESAIYNWIDIMKEKTDIIFMYNQVSGENIKQLKRLRQIVKCVKFENQKIYCKKFIYYGFNPQDIENNIVQYDDIIQQVCCDVEAIKYNGPISPKTTKIFADSKASAEAFKRKYKRECGVLHNLFNLPETKRCLNLMSATRLSGEKGYDVMKLMAKKMIAKQIPFEWTVFTNDIPDELIDGFIFRTPRLNVVDFMSNKCYGLQLSKTESWGCTITEFLEKGTPVVCTDFPSAFEQVEDGVNGFILKRDLSNIDEVIDKMYSSYLKGFKYEPKYDIQEWLDVLGDIGVKEEKYVYEDTEGTEVQVLISTYFSLEKMKYKVGDTFFVTDEGRLKQLLGDNVYKRAYVKVIGD